MARVSPLFLLFSSLLLCSVPSLGAEPPAEIAVTGEAQSMLAPDMALLELTVSRQADSARAALDANSQAMRQVLAQLQAEGIAERDIQTSNFAIQPRYVYPQNRDGNPPKLDGYTVRNSISVQVRDLERLGELLDKSVSLGVNEGGNISFTNSDPSAAVELARTLAVRDALARAQTIARAAGVKLGDILSLSENSFTPQPRMARLESAMADSAGSVPVVGGENSYHVSVSLRIAIEQ